MPTLANHLSKFPVTARGKGGKVSLDKMPSRQEVVDLIISLMPDAPLPIKPSDEYLRSLIRPLIPQFMPEAKDGKTPTEDELLALIRPLIPKPKDGKTPTKDELIALIRQLIPESPTIPTPAEFRALILNVLMETEEFKTMLFDALSAGLIRDKLMTLTGKERLDASAIKNLPGKKLSSGLIRSAVYGGSTAATTSETFTTTGGSEVLTLAATPTAIVLVVLGANTLFETDDYTATGATVTLLNPDIPAGMKVKVIYTT